MNAITNQNQTGPHLPMLMGERCSPALAIMLDERLFEKTKLIATYLSRADGFVPPHLIGKEAACFAVAVNSLVWNQNPYAVAKSTYQTPGGQVGYEGKLVHAILLNSGQIDGDIEVEHYGDWSKVQGKFEKKRSEKGKDYAVPAWKPEDEKGLGLKLSCTLRGRSKPTTFTMDLVQAFPRNSTLWATDPKSQLEYVAMRRFANLRVPHLLMGVPFDREDLEPTHFGPDNAKDITPPPEPTMASVQAEAQAAVVVEQPGTDKPSDPPPPPAAYDVFDADGVAVSHADPAEAATALVATMDALYKARNLVGFDRAREANRPVYKALNSIGTGRNRPKFVAEMNTALNAIFSEREKLPADAHIEPGDQGGSGQPHAYWRLTRPWGDPTDYDTVEQWVKSFKDAVNARGLGAAEVEALSAKNQETLQRMSEEEPDAYDDFMSWLTARD